MKGYKWDYIGLEPNDWHSLKNAVLDASFGNDSRRDINESVKEHEASLLLNEYFDQDNKRALDKAASILGGGGENPWVALFKS